MQIDMLYIKNYRGLDIKIEGIQEVSIVIGQNDSGKTNICSAILKVLDFNKRKIPFLLTDSTNSNGENIEIKIRLLANDLTNEQLALVGNYIHKVGDDKIIEVKLNSVYNNETMEYEDTLLYGKEDMDFEEVKANTQTQLDKVLSIIYITPVYDINQSKKDFFRFKEVYL